MLLVGAGIAVSVGGLAASARADWVIGGCPAGVCAGVAQHRATGTSGDSTSTTGAVVGVPGQGSVSASQYDGAWQESTHAEVTVGGVDQASVRQWGPDSTSPDHSYRVQAPGVTVRQYREHRYPEGVVCFDEVQVADQPAQRIECPVELPPVPSVPQQSLPSLPIPP